MNIFKDMSRLSIFYVCLISFIINMIIIFISLKLFDFDRISQIIFNSLSFIISFYSISTIYFYGRPYFLKLFKQR
jgi:hypothetical protein